MRNVLHALSTASTCTNSKLALALSSYFPLPDLAMCGTKVTEKKDVQKIARKERSRTLLLNREDVKPERIQRKRRNWNPTNKYLEQYQ